jgi:hypothetical protein
LLHLISLFKGATAAVPTTISFPVATRFTPRLIAGLSTRLLRGFVGGLFGDFFFESDGKDLLFLFFFTQRPFTASTDFDGALKLSILENHTTFFGFNNFVVADRD